MSSPLPAARKRDGARRGDRTTLHTEGEPAPSRATQAALLLVRRRGGGRGAQCGAGRRPRSPPARRRGGFELRLLHRRDEFGVVDLGCCIKSPRVDCLKRLAVSAGGRDLRHAAPVRRSHRHPRRLAVGSGHATERQQGRRGLAVVYCSRLQRDSASNWVASTAGPWLGRFSGAVWACCRVVPLQS